MPIACSSAATVCASKRRRKPSLLDRVQSLMERSQPSSGRSATPADINRNGRPTSIGTGGRHQSECPADLIGIRSHATLEPMHLAGYWPAPHCCRMGLTIWHDMVGAGVHDCLTLVIGG